MFGKALLHGNLKGRVFVVSALVVGVIVQGHLHNVLLRVKDGVDAFVAFQRRVEERACAQREHADAEQGARGEQAAVMGLHRQTPYRESELYTTLHFSCLVAPEFRGGAPKNFCAPTRLPQAASSAGISSRVRATRRACVSGGPHRYRSFPRYQDSVLKSDVKTGRGRSGYWCS